MNSDEHKGCARVSVETSAPAEVAFDALVQSDKLGAWLGTPTTSLRPRGVTRIEFGDGDFFAVEGIELEPPTRLRYVWRFLGLGAKNLITWTVTPEGSRTVIRVTDEQPERDDLEVEMLCEGWRDFLDRLARYLATGESARYDWRRDLDGGVELSLGVGQAAASLFTPEALDRWQPWRASSWISGARLVVSDGEQPAKLRLAEVDCRSTELRFTIAAPEWRQATRCELALSPRSDGSMLTFRHTGWDQIDPRDQVQRDQRKRFCRLWITSLLRARAYTGTP